MTSIPWGPKLPRFPQLRVLLLFATLVASAGHPNPVLARASGTAGAPDEAPDPRRLAPATIIGTTEETAVGHDIGPFTLQLTNIGILGNPFLNTLSAGWRGGEYLFFAGLWVGAIGEDSEPHVSQVANPFRPEWRPSLLAVDRLYESWEGQANGLRPGLTDGDDDGDGVTDEDPHNGKDDDQDGRIDEDFAAIGQQMYSCEYRDDTPEALTQLNDHRPLGLRVRQRSFQWGVAGVDEFVGVDFHVRNVGDQRLRSVYIGFFVDADAGPRENPDYFSDDLVGYSRIDTTIFNPELAGACSREQLSIDIGYIHDAPDDGGTIRGGDVPGYLGVMFLGHSTDDTGVKAPTRVGLTTVRWTSSGGAYPVGDPRTDFERYDLLSSGGLPRRNATKPDDYRFTLAAGPFSELNPGDELSFQIAFVIGDGYQGMISNAVAAQRVYNGRYVDGDLDPTTGVDGRERCLRVVEPPGEILWDNPCDTLNISVRHRGTNCLWVDDDCSACSGSEGRETLLHWVGLTSPVAPQTNMDPDLAERRIFDPEFAAYLDRPGHHRSVVLQWDNNSELRRDPLTGANLFEGYRIWRVDGWARPEGTIGPAPGEWSLLREYRLHPRDGLGEASPLHLRRVRRPDRNLVKEERAEGSLFHVGRYEWTDTGGVTNGKLYYYAVTAFGMYQRLNPATGEMEEVELHGQPSAVQREAVVASWDAGDACTDLRVVPNPYRGGADWDLRPSDCDPTGTKIAFANLPEGWTRLSLYTLAGDLVLAATPDDSRVLGSCSVNRLNRHAGTFYWDLLSRNGQNVVAGIYLYAVETPRDICRGRFVIIR